VVVLVLERGQLRDKRAALVKQRPAPMAETNAVAVQILCHPWFLTDLPVGSLSLNSRLGQMDNACFGQCKQTAEQILELVEVRRC
jgi:hypothetical protein